LRKSILCTLAVDRDLEGYITKIEEGKQKQTKTAFPMKLGKLHEEEEKN